MNSRVLILLAYFERPNLVRLALESIKNQSYKNWEVAFCDDGVNYPGKDIVYEIFDEFDLAKFKFYETKHTVQQKNMQGGSMSGSMINQAVDESDADIVLILCDDDALYPESLEKLVKFYEENPSIDYSYGKVSIFNPNDRVEYSNIEDNLNYVLNNRSGPISPANTVDASQVSWRHKKYKDAGIKFPSPQTAALDAVIYQRLENAFGKCHENGIIVQYKAIFPGQMGNRMHDQYNTGDNIDRS